MKKKIYTFLAVASMAFTAMAQGQPAGGGAGKLYTLDDIFKGETTIQVQELINTGISNTPSTSCLGNEGMPDRSYFTTFTRIDNQTVRIDNVMNSGKSFDFTLANEYNAAAPNGGTRLVRAFESPQTSYSVTLLPGVPQGWHNTKGYLAFNWNDESHCVLMIRETEDGMIYFSSPYDLNNKNSWGLPYIQSWAIRNGKTEPSTSSIALSIEYFQYTPNATARHQKVVCEPLYKINYYYYFPESADLTSWQYYQPVAEEFSAYVEYDFNANRVKILNLANFGLNYDYDNTTHQSSRKLIEGTIDPETGVVTFDPGQYATDFWLCNWGWGPATRLPYRLMSLNGEYKDIKIENNLDDFSENLTGKLSTADVHHNDAAHGFVTHGGKRRTHEGFELTIDQPFTFVYTDQLLMINYQPLPAGEILAKINWHNVFLNSVYDGGADVTLHTLFVRSDNPIPASRSIIEDETAKHSHTGVYRSGETYFVVPVINTIKNEKHVDSYEVVCVPGIHKTADEMHANLDKAIKLEPAFWEGSDPNFKADSSKGGVYRPGLFVLPSDNKQYTMTVKANYKPETGLTPTYHDLYNIDLEENIPTGIFDINEDYAAATVTTVGHDIVINNYEGTVEVYTTSGALVYSGTDTTVSVAPGLYIINLSGETTKVIVR